MTTKEKKGISAKEVAELRQRTGAGMMDCKKALEECNGDMDAAIEQLRKSGAVKAEKRGGRETREGLIGSYIHFNGKIGVMVELGCETDFVARTDDFRALAKDLCLHIASARPMTVSKEQVPADVVERERRVAEATAREEGKPEAALPRIVEGRVNGFYKDAVLVEQASVQDSKRTVQQVLDEAGVTVTRFVRFEVGQG